MRHPRLWAVLVSTGLVFVLWMLSWSRPQGDPIQVAMQVLMVVPVAVGGWASAARLRASWTWALPLLGFLLPSSNHRWLGVWLLTAAVTWGVLFLARSVCAGT